MKAPRWLRSLRRFLEIEALSGIVLAVATVTALILASSPWAEAYRGFFEWRWGAVGEHVITPHWLIDDVLMTIFFFVVGLEIRRELSIGSLSDRKRAALPAIAALGGMIAPAGLYLLVAGSAITRAGWGIPTATDIAFALGVLSLLGRRVPTGLRILLLALAVIDDLGAIVVIAVFYTRGIHVEGLVVAALALAIVLIMQRAHVRSKRAYAIPALLLWGGIFFAGIHPTIAGVVLGLLTPTFASERLILRLHPYVAYGVMPIFALANAGVRLGSVATDDASLRVILGITLGLVVGKPLGILLASELALRSRIAEAPEGVTTRHLVVLGAIGGVGFTMALFVSGLAFVDASLLTAARMGVLAASALAAVIALVLGRTLLPVVDEDLGRSAQTDPMVSRPPADASGRDRA